MLASCQKPTAVPIIVPLLLILELAWSCAVQAAGMPAVGHDDPWRLCAHEIRRAEQAQHIPALLLGAIAQVESGRWNEEKRAIFAWPWTVMAEGRGRYLPTREAAIAEVRALRARGVRNIDVGCMQVNLRYHPDAFATIEEAFDPMRNVTYAAQFLAGLKREKRSWAKAVAHYHSATPALHRPYRAKVYEAWRAERRRAIHAQGDLYPREALPQLVTLGERVGAIGVGTLF